MAPALRIAKRQTTYWDFASLGKAFRVRFIGKQEHHFVETECPMFEIVKSHPVLLDYQFPWRAIYISSAAESAESLFERMAVALATDISPWRNSSAYFNQHSNPMNLLFAGYGLLFRGPNPLADRISSCLSEAGVIWRALPERPARSPMQALVAGRNFVVAKEFAVEET